MALPTARSYALHAALQAVWLCGESSNSGLCRRGSEVVDSLRVVAQEFLVLRHGCGFTQQQQQQQHSTE
jgi:hypothetical protein